MNTFFTSFVLIALGELGDKTQLLTFNFALKYSFKVVASAIIFASLVLQFFAVFFGAFIGSFIDPVYLKIIAGALFVSFGIWEFIPELEKPKLKNFPKLAPFFLITFAFILAELGDKTQLAAFALAMNSKNWISIWAGASLGMILVNLISIGLAGFISDKITRNTLKYITSCIFIVFGIYMLVTAFLLTPNFIFSPS